MSLNVSHHTGDTKLVDALLFDLKASQSTVDAWPEQAALHEKYSIETAFLITRAGATRWRDFPYDAEGSGEKEALRMITVRAIDENAIPDEDNEDTDHGAGEGLEEDGGGQKRKESHSPSTTAEVPNAESTSTAPDNQTENSSKEMRYCTVEYLAVLFNCKGMCFLGFAFVLDTFWISIRGPWTSPFTSAPSWETTR